MVFLILHIKLHIIKILLWSVKMPITTILWKIPITTIMCYSTFCFMASTFDLNLFPRRPVHPAWNSGPREVSAVKECLVLRLLSKMNPGKSSRRMVACCCPSELWMWSSPSCNLWAMDVDLNPILFIITHDYYILKIQYWSNSIFVLYLYLKITSFYCTQEIYNDHVKEPLKISVFLYFTIIKVWINIWKSSLLIFHSFHHKYLFALKWPVSND